MYSFRDSDIFKLYSNNIPDEIDKPQTSTKHRLIWYSHHPSFHEIVSDLGQAPIYTTKVQASWVSHNN